MQDLTYGMEGYPVALLQYALGRAGMEPGNADGIFGRKTAKALMHFQRDRGLAGDGIAGKLTWAALYPYISGYTLHRIAPGDTICRLTDRYGITATALETANPGLDPLALPVGKTVIVPLDMPVVARSIPYSGLLIGLILKGLTARYPFLDAYEIGRSVMGQRILAVSIGSGRKKVGYTAAHHANEWITVPVLLRFLEEYAAAFSGGGRLAGIPAKDLYETATLHMVPMVNPDGVDLVTGALSPEDSFYAQAHALSAYYPDIRFPEGWKSNISGIDLNLQYPAGWERLRRIKYHEGYTRPGPREYVGSGPLIAPESRAMARWTRAHDFSLTLSYHTQGRIVYCDRRMTTEAKAMGEAMSRSSGYALELSLNAADHGGYEDWFVQTWRRPGFTVKAGSGENPLPLRQLEEIYRENLPILVRGITLSP